MQERSGIILKPQSLEDVPEELMHLIQSYILDPKEAARTCILSKSWLHAWSTIPTLRLRQQLSVGRKQIGNDHVMMVDRTLQRYLGDNIPFETIDLLIPINNDQVSDSLAEKWIRPVATRTCVKELSLTVIVYVQAPYTLPDEIFSNEFLRKISIHAHILFNNLYISSNLMINCVSLRVLDLKSVNISEEVLDNLLSTCSLLEEVRISYCMGLKTVKVENLRYLCKLMIIRESGDKLEIYDVPNLSCFEFSSFHEKDFHLFPIDSLASVTELSLESVTIDKAFLDMIESKFLLLQKLTLNIQGWSSESFNITCLSLKELSLLFMRRCPILNKVQVFAPKLQKLTLKIQGWSSESFNITCLSLKELSLLFMKRCPILNKVQVFAPKLRLFEYYDCNTRMPSFIFPAIVPEQIRVKLDINGPIHGLFFVKMREALMLSSNFDIYICAKYDVAMPVNMDVDDLRRRFPIPATNVQKLSVQTNSKKSLPEYSLFFNAFFSICRPKNVIALKGSIGNNYICNKLIKEVMETNTKEGSWPHYLQGLEIKYSHNGNWETLTDSLKSLLFKKDPCHVDFKLNWCLS